MSYIQTNFLTTPAAIVNEALDMLGESGQIIGDIQDGTVVAEAARRYYGQGLRQLLRTAHWDMARKRAQLQLLGDAIDNPPPTGVSSYVECPWSYAYAWPIDAVYGRWLPWNPSNNQAQTPTGIPLAGNPAGVNYWSQPGRFLVSSSDQYPVETGFTPWNQLPDFQRTFGVGPTNRKIILSDCPNAEFVYTRFVPVIEEWDALFRNAFVTMLAIAIAPTAIKDQRVRLAEMARLVPMLKNMIADARVANGNESGFPQTTEHIPPWITARNGGYRFDNNGISGGTLGLYLPWESFSLGGSVF